MTLIEKAARALCTAHGENPDTEDGSAARWIYHVQRAKAVIEALYEPSAAMTESGSEIIRHVGTEEDDASYRSDAANVWRFMMDALLQEVNSQNLG